MSVRCLNRKCSVEISEDWSFCSLCGADNREPHQRTPIADCDHRIERGEFCVMCGVSAIDTNETLDPEANWREIGGWVLVVAGVAMVLVSQLLLRDSESSIMFTLPAANPGNPHLGANPSRGLEMAYTLGRIGFLSIPAGVVLIV